MASIFLKNQCATLAQRLMFSSGLTQKSIEELMVTLQVEYRTGKNFQSILHAGAKAVKSGGFKTEFTLSLFEVYLADVLKSTKEEKVNA